MNTNMYLDDTEFDKKPMSRLFINHLSPNRNYQLYQETTFLTSGNDEKVNLHFNSENCEIHVKQRVISKLLNYFNILKNEVDHAYCNTQKIISASLIVSKITMVSPRRNNH